MISPIQIYREVDQPLQRILYDMECTGITVDLDVLDAVRAQCEDQMAHEEQAIKAFGITNTNSTAQIAKVLYEELRAPILKKSKETGKPSTDAGTLATLEVVEGASEEVRQLARHIINYREPATLIKMFLTPLPGFVGDDGRIHPTINGALVETGRLSMERPNPMNIPHRRPIGRALRRAFVPAEGLVMVKADESQLELRIAAALSGDAVLTDAYTSTPPKDIHAVSCQGIFGFVDDDHRTITKPFNFGSMYRQGPLTMSRNILKDTGVYLTPSTCEQYINGWWDTYHGVDSWQQEEWDAALARGYKVNYYGRRDYLPPNATSLPRWQLEAIKREIGNYPIQCTGADYVRRWMLKAAPELRRIGASLLLQVHDELLVECTKGQVDDVSEVLARTGAGTLEGIPLFAEPHVGANWQDVK